MGFREPHYRASAKGVSIDQVVFSVVTSAGMRAYVRARGYIHIQTTFPLLLVGRMLENLGLQ